MKQVTQRLRDGRIEVVEVPPPQLTPDGVLVDVHASLLSAGTERSKVAAGRQSLIGKARSRPDEVRKVVEKAQRDGVRETLASVRARLDQPSAIGYSTSGVVSGVGVRVPGLTVGDRVACGGGDHAVHAAVNSVPGNLCVALPSGVSFEEGSFATVGSIALHGVRQADVRLGERVAVVGLGLVGQLAGQLLRASGCAVVGVDLDAGLVDTAIALGAADVGFARDALGGGTLPDAAGDCDAVLITAATRSTDPVELAARLCRDRGRVVVLGDVSTDLPRAAYYDKEIEVRLSRSYGPGRYDRAYEERGLDYPIGYVRWTERRNMAAFLELVASGKVDVRSLITELVPVDEAPRAYEQLLGSERSPLGIVLHYPEEVLVRHEPPAAPPRVPAASATATTVVGAGSFASRILIPGLQSAGFSLVSVASANGLSARAAADRFGFARAVGVEEAVADPDAGLAVIATRHNSHADLAAAALTAGKHVFVEKPPCLTVEQLELLRAAELRSGRVLAVGFNRRHAPLAEALRTHVAGRGVPVEVLVRVNAGPLPGDHWLNDPDEGGGRLLGEGCHFVDLACWLVGALPKRVLCSLRPTEGLPPAAAQTFSVTLDFADGSLATILYGAGGAAGLGKEHGEAHGGGRSAVLDDFRSLTLYDGKRNRRQRTRRQDKGHSAQLVHLRRLIEGDVDATTPSPLDTMAATLAALRSAEAGRAISV